MRPFIYAIFKITPHGRITELHCLLPLYAAIHV